MINFIMFSFVLFFAAYLVGSLSSAVIIAKLWCLPDPRNIGSKNPGATNMLRVGGKLPAFLTLLCDALKGFIPVYFSKLYLASTSIDPHYNQWIVSGVFLAVVLGHLYPIFFQFKGGKGVATALGGFFALKMGLGFMFVVIWLVVAALTRYSALSALIASAIMPVITYFWIAPEYTLAILIVTLLIFWRHRVNIKQLLEGTEAKIGASNKKNP